MHGAALVSAPFPGWAPRALGAVLPGSYVAILATGPDADRVAVDGRLAGLHLRDTLLLLRNRGTGFAFLFRAPLSEPSIVQNARKVGTGGLNIAQSRVGVTVETWPKSRSYAPGQIQPGGVGQTQATGARPPGRWPANIGIVHSEACQRSGTKRVKASSPSEMRYSTRRTGVHAERGGHQTIGRVQEVVGYGEPDGKETTDSWLCGDDCPATWLDRQSGMAQETEFKPPGHSGKSGPVLNPEKGWHNNSMTRDKKYSPEAYGDPGGASRYYAQFGSELEAIAWILRLITPPEIPATMLSP